MTPLTAHHRLCVHARLFVGVFQSQFLRELVNFGDACPPNGSKNDKMAPSATLGCPHEGPRVDQPRQGPTCCRSPPTSSP